MGMKQESVFRVKYSVENFNLKVGIGDYILYVQILSNKDNSFKFLMWFSFFFLPGYMTFTLLAWGIYLSGFLHEENRERTVYPAFESQNRIKQ